MSSVGLFWKGIINSFQLRITNYELRIKKVGSPQKAKLRLSCVVRCKFILRVCFVGLFENDR